MEAFIKQEDISVECQPTVCGQTYGFIMNRFDHVRGEAVLGRGTGTKVRDTCMIGGGKGPLGLGLCIGTKQTDR